jgi:hypothetical protein
VLRPRGEIEDGLVGEIGDAVEPGDRGKRRRRAGGNDEAPRRDLGCADDDGFAILEARGAFDHPHPEAVETRLRIVRRDRGDDAMHVPVNLGEVDLRRFRRHAERGGIGNGARTLAGRDQRFGGNAAGIEAFAPHLAPLDEHDRHAERGRGGGNREATRARADHTDVRGETFRHAVYYRSQFFSRHARHAVKLAQTA